MYRVNDYLKESIDESFIDFFESSWYVFLKDDTWVEEELKNFQNNFLQVSYFQRNIIDGFLVEIEDMLEISDFPFCWKDADDDFLDVLANCSDINFKIILVDQHNKVCAIRQETLNKNFQQTMNNCLAEQIDKDYDSDVFTYALDKVQRRFDSYQLEEFSKVSQKWGVRHEN